MKCVVINLADQTARWEAMAAQFAGWPFPVARFDAIRALRMSEAEIAALYSPSRNRRQYHRPLIPGEIGCYASHVAVWRSLLASEEPSVAVFEDDVTVKDELRVVLRAAGTLDSDWGILKLLGRNKEKAAEAQPWIPGHRLIRYQRVPSLCGAYVISRNGARQLLSAQVPFGRPADVDMRYWWESGCRVMGVQPYPVALSNFCYLSTIGERNRSMNLAVKLRRLFLRWDYDLKNWQANRRLRQTRFPLGATIPPGPLSENLTTTLS